MAASVVIAGGEWELCGDTYFRGQCVTLGPGKYPITEELRPDARRLLGAPGARLAAPLAPGQIDSPEGDPYIAPLFAPLPGWRNW